MYLAIDKYDNLYISDTFNHKIRLITKNKHVVTINTISNTNFIKPKKLRIYQNNLYVIDSGNNLMRKIIKNQILPNIIPNK